MPLPRRKDTDGTGGAPVLDLLNTRVQLFDVEEYIEPYTVTRKSDGAEFTFDPAFKCSVKIIDDGQGGTDNGATFFETFKYKKDGDDWALKQNSKLGALTEVVKPGYFDDASIPELDASDLEAFEMMCRVKPKKNPTTGAVTGSTIDWETMRPAPTPEKVAAAVGEAEEDFDDIPF